MPLPHVEDEFYLYFDSDNKSDNEEATHKGSSKFDHGDGSDRDGRLLEGYESDIADFGPIQSLDNEHPFSAISHIVVVKCLRIVQI